jgi:EAL domain-containing protein (putative c-di-GMP-specific phosphodiesterase class I)
MPSAAAIPPFRGSLATAPAITDPSGAATGSPPDRPQPHRSGLGVRTNGAAAVPSESPNGAISITVGTDSAEAGRRLQEAALRRVISEGGPRIVYQPQLSLSRLVVDGYEALARFPDSPIRGTEQWFARARELDLGPALEACALERALRHRDDRPAGTTLAVNLSPGVLASPAVAAVLPDDLSGIEIELTEHEWAPSAGPLRRQLDRLRDRGARVAIDDVGVAHSGLRRVMELAPDRIKLDRHLVQGVSSSTVKAALIRAVVDFADHIGASVCAEGVENVDDLEALADLDVGYAQGWVVGLPEPGFGEADPIAVAAGRDSLNTMLLGRRPPGPISAEGVPTRRTHDSTADVEELLVQLTTVTSLEGLGELAGTCAGVIGGDTLLVSVLSPDGTTIRSVENPTGGQRDSFSLAEFPLTRHCLDSRSVMPIYLGSSGDDAEWQVLAGLGFEAALLVPVISRDRVLGLLECYRKGSAPWTRRQIRSARTVAAMLGPVLDTTLTLQGRIQESKI